MKRRRFMSLLGGGFVAFNIPIPTNEAEALPAETDETLLFASTSQLLQQSTRQARYIGPLINAHDGVTVEADLFPVIQLSKDGAPFVDGPTGVHDSEGLYAIILTAAHTDTLGQLVVCARESAVHLPVWHQFLVVPADRLPSTRDGEGGR